MYSVIFQTSTRNFTLVRAWAVLQTSNKYISVHMEDEGFLEILGKYRVNNNQHKMIHIA